MSITLLAERASELLLFDNRSQHLLLDELKTCKKGSYEHCIVLLSLAAMGFYNARSSEGNVDLYSVILKAKKYIQQIKREALDPFNRLLCFTLIADLEMEASLIEFESHYRGLPQPQKNFKKLFNEHDEQVRTLLVRLIKTFPSLGLGNVENEWIPEDIAMVPIYSTDIIGFYKATTDETDNRHTRIKNILFSLRQAAVLNLGGCYYKQFMSTQKLKQEEILVIKKIAISSASSIYRELQKSIPKQYEDAVDLKPPKRVSIAGMLEAVKDVKQQMNRDIKARNHTKYTTTLLQLGILYYLVKNYEMAIRILVRVLQETKRISPEEKTKKQHRHEEFADIPFMIGSSYLRLYLQKYKDAPDEVSNYLDKAKSSFDAAIRLSSRYHQGYINRALVEALKPDGKPLKIVYDYKSAFNNSIAELDGQVFQILAHQEMLESGTKLSPKMFLNMLLYHTCKKSMVKDTEAAEMLADLKTLYILNSHDIIISYYDRYKSATRDETSSFYEGLQDPHLHSALLFYFAHSYAAVCLKQTKDGISIDYNQLEHAVELNTVSLFFFEKNPSSLRLLRTLDQIFRFSLKNIHNNWEQQRINGNMNMRLLIFEEYTRMQKACNEFKEKLEEINFPNILDDIQLSEETLEQIEKLLPIAQRKRVHDLVYDL
ncbi:MAG: hypothetical protein ACI86H_000909 [bacterium]|jgi:hypothetical protein